MFWPIALVVMLLGTGAAMVFAYNPSTHSFYPACQFHKLTGLNCPGCGMTRSLHALLHAEFSTALRNNALLILCLLIVVARGGWVGVKMFRGQPRGEMFPAKWLCLLLALALVFSVLRNLPAFAYLSP